MRALLIALLLLAGASQGATVRRDHPWLTRGVGDEAILGLREVPGGDVLSLKVAFRLENCSAADIARVRLFRQPVWHGGAPVSHLGTPTLTGGESLYYAEGAGLDPDGDGAFTVDFHSVDGAKDNWATPQAGDSLWVTVCLADGISPDASISATVVGDLRMDDGTIPLAEMEDPAPRANRVFPFRDRIGAYAKADALGLWEREAAERLPTLTDLYVIGNGDASCWVSATALNVNQAFRDAFARLKALRDRHNPDLRLKVVTNGNPHKGDATNDAMADANRAAFAASAATLLEELGADGLDVDWEYCDTETRHANFARTLGALKDAFAAKGRGWELSAAVNASYLTPKAAAFASLDYANVMAYDGTLNAPYTLMEGDWQRLTGLGVHPRRLHVGQAIYGNDRATWNQPGWGTVVGFPDYTGYDCDVATFPNSGVLQTFTGPTTYRGKVRQCLEWGAGGIMSWGYYSDASWGHAQSLGRHQARVIWPRREWAWPTPPQDADGFYLLDSEEDWFWLRDNPSASARLAADITFAYDPAPIPSFSGTLDGAGHTLTLPEDVWIVSYDDAALFRDLSGTVRDLTIDFAGRVVSRRDRKFDVGSGQGNGLSLSQTGAGHEGGSAALLAIMLRTGARIERVTLRLRPGSEIRGQHEVGALAAGLWATGGAVTLTDCRIDAAGLLQAHGSDSLGHDVTMGSANGDVGLLVGQCNWEPADGRVIIEGCALTLRPDAALRSRLGHYRSAAGAIANLAHGLTDAVSLRGLSLFWFGGEVSGPGGHATQPLVGNRNGVGLDLAPVLDGRQMALRVRPGADFPWVADDLWVSDGAPEDFALLADDAPLTASLVAALADILPAPDPDVRAYRFADAVAPERLLAFDGVTLRAEGAPDADGAQALRVVGGDLRVSGMGLGDGSLWLEAAVAGGTFRADAEPTLLAADDPGGPFDAVAATCEALAPDRRRLSLPLVGGTRFLRLRVTAPGLGD